MPCPTSLVVKNGSKAFALTSSLMPRAVVGHREHDVLARNDFGLRGGIFVIEVDISRFDRELSAVRHRIARVDGKIENRKFELIGIGQGPPHPAAQHRLHRNLLAKRAAHQIGHARYHAPKFERLGIERLLAREGQQAAGSAPRRAARRAWHGSAERRSRSTSGAGSPSLRSNGLKIADDDHQEIVEVVGDASGELADGFHLLRLPRALVGGAPLGEVARNLGKSDMRCRPALGWR